MSEPFLNIHCHTRYSNRDCINQIPDLFNVATENNNKECFTITDHGNVAGWIEYYNECKERGIKPAFGVELYVSQNRDRLLFIKDEIKKEKDPIKKAQYSYELDELKSVDHQLVIVKDEKGFNNLLEIHNEAFENGFYRFPIAKIEDLLNINKHKKSGLITTSGCLSSITSKYIRNEEYDEAYEFIKLMKESYGSDYYLEIQPIAMPEIAKVNKKLFEFGKKLGIDCIIANDAHYPSQKYADTHKALLLLQGKQKIADYGKKVWRIKTINNKGEMRVKKFDKGTEFRKGVLVDNIKIGDKIKDVKIIEKEEKDKIWLLEATDLSYKNEKQMIQYVKDNHPEIEPYLKKLISNNKKLYKSIENIEIDSNIKMPAFENDDEKLKKLVIAGLKEFGLFDAKEYKKRAKHELKVIKENSFSSYFLILKEVVDFAKNNNIGVGVGRGSAVSSVVGLVLGLHRVDPIKYNLRFERFLSTERGKAKINMNIDGRTYEFLESQEIPLANGNKKEAKNILKGDEIDENFLNDLN